MEPRRSARPAGRRRSSGIGFGVAETHRVVDRRKWSDLVEETRGASALSEMEAMERGEDPVASARYRMRDDRRYRFERGGAAGMSDACADLRRAGELDAAEAECRAALPLARGALRGAIHYELGRIAEARDDDAAARAAYEASLRARPGNAAVRARLDAL